MTTHSVTSHNTSRDSHVHWSSKESLSKAGVIKKKVIYKAVKPQSTSDRSTPPPELEHNNRRLESRWYQKDRYQEESINRRRLHTGRDKRSRYESILTRPTNEEWNGRRKVETTKGVLTTTEGKVLPNGMDWRRCSSPAPWDHWIEPNRTESN